jgi:hypothetical protein
MKTYYALQTCICCTHQYATDTGIKQAAKVPKYFPDLSHCLNCGSSTVVKTEKMDSKTATLFNRKGTAS